MALVMETVPHGQTTKGIEYGQNTTFFQNATRYAIQWLHYTLADIKAIPALLWRRSSLIALVLIALTLVYQLIVTVLMIVPSYEIYDAIADRELLDQSPAYQKPIIPLTGLIGCLLTLEYFMEIYELHTSVIFYAIAMFLYNYYQLVNGMILYGTVGLISDGLFGLYYSVTLSRPKYSFKFQNRLGNMPIIFLVLATGLMSFVFYKSQKGLSHMVFQERYIHQPDISRYFDGLTAVLAALSSFLALGRFGDVYVVNMSIFGMHLVNTFFFQFVDMGAIMTTSVALMGAFIIYFKWYVWFLNAVRSVEDQYRVLHLAAQMVDSASHQSSRGSHTKTNWMEQVRLAEGTGAGPAACEGGADFNAFVRELDIKSDMTAETVPLLPTHAPEMRRQSFHV